MSIINDELIKYLIEFINNSPSMLDFDRQGDNNILYIRSSRGDSVWDNRSSSVVEIQYNINGDIIKLLGVDITTNPLTKQLSDAINNNIRQTFKFKRKMNRLKVK